MKNIRKLAIIVSLLLIFLAIGTASAADDTPNTFINGTVTCCNSTEPIQGATVDVKSPTGSSIASNITGPDGTYNISFYSEDNTLIVSAIAPGHIIPTETINLDETRSAEVNFKLGTLTLTKGSWDTIGLDHNNPGTGPNQYLIQVRITNNALTTATNVTANLTWTTTNLYIDLAPGETPIKNLGDILAGATVDVFYLIEIQRTSLAYGASRNYTVTAAGTNTGTPDTITGTLYVEGLMSQNRNRIISITASNNTPAIGDIIAITMTSATASRYDIVNLPLAYDPRILQPLNVTTTYGTNTNNNIRLDSPGKTNFVSVWYFKVIGTGTTQLYGIITDQSGQSFHYNADYGTNVTITAEELADLGIIKVVNNTAPNLNELVNFTITITNYGPNNATGVIVEDLLPTGLLFQTATASKGTYTPANGTWNVGTLNYLETATLNIIARITQTGTIINRANVTSDITDPNPVNNNATATLNSPPASDLAIAKTVDKTEPYIGENILYTITVYNAGPDNNTGVVVTDLMPAGLQFLSYTASHGTYDNNTDTWTIGNLQAFETATLNILVRATTSGTFLNRASVTGDAYDPFTGDNNATSTLTALPVTDIKVEKTANQTTVNYLDTVKFTITVTNIGPDDSTGVTVVDLLPPGLELVSATTSLGIYTPINGGVWIIGSLAKDASATLEITARVVTSNTTLTNIASVTKTNEFDNNTENDHANVTISVPAAADLTISKTANQTTVNYLDTVKFTITVENLGPDTATGVIVEDLLPAGFEWISDSSNGSYDPLSGIWTVGELANGTMATLEVIAKVMVSDVTITNVATVTSDIYDPNLDNNRDSVTIKVSKKPTPKPPKPPKPGEVPMQPTGTPLSLMVFAVLSIIAGFATSRKI